MFTWQPGDSIALRGMYNQQPWFVQSALVVKDSPTEVALLLMPSAECAAPPGYIHQKHGDHSHWERWQEVLGGAWSLEKYRWHTNRFLILLEPKKYYATIYIWTHATNVFKGYYINFQLPFERSPCGFDTYDLELDLVIDPDFRWQWKDVEDYQKGIQLGAIRAEWVQAIEHDQHEVLERLHQRQYPLNEHWIDWLPDKSWSPSLLPIGWDT